MKQKEAVQAYRSLQTLNDQKLPGYLARRIFDLSEKLKPTWEFQRREEEKIYESYPSFDKRIGGFNISGLSDDEKEKVNKDVQAIDNELKKLSELDVEGFDDYEKIEFDMDQANINLTPNEFGTLKPFIDFI